MEHLLQATYLMFLLKKKKNQIQVFDLRFTVTYHTHHEKNSCRALHSPVTVLFGL